jgi:acyl-CoA reductase-like NAD-dependent aldehyde dehydrogenase
MNDYGLIIDNRKTAASPTFDVTNPATGELVGRAPIASREQLEVAMASASMAFESWGLTGEERRKQACQFFYPPTLVADISDATRLVDEEQFGPVLPIIRYSDLDDAQRRVNASEFGLSGSVWSDDLEKAKAIAQRLECGTVWVNRHAALAPNVPIGGVKSSGIGVEFGEEGLAEYTNIQVVSIDKARTCA